MSFGTSSAYKLGKSRFRKGKVKIWINNGKFILYLLHPPQQCCDKMEMPKEINQNENETCMWVHRAINFVHSIKLLIW